MKTVSFSELSHMNLDVRSLEVFPAVWAERKQFSQYETVPRATSAFFLILTDVQGFFLAADGTRVDIAKGDILYIPEGICYRAAFQGGKADTRIDTITVNFYGEKVTIAGEE